MHVRARRLHLGSCRCDEHGIARRTLKRLAGGCRCRRSRRGTPVVIGRLPRTVGPVFHTGVSVGALDCLGKARRGCVRNGSLADSRGGHDARRREVPCHPRPCRSCQSRRSIGCLFGVFYGKGLCTLSWSERFVVRGRVRRSLVRNWPWSLLLEWAWPVEKCSASYFGALHELLLRSHSLRSIGERQSLRLVQG